MTTDTSTVDALLDKINKTYQVPGQTFRLPSKGKFYKNGELSSEVLDGEVVVYPMSTLEELYTRSFDMLFQGTAIEKTILHCVPQIKKPFELLNKDVDYLMSCIRKVSYGEHIPYKFTCPTPPLAPPNPDAPDEIPVNVIPKEYEYMIPVSSFLKNTKEVGDHIEDMLQFEFNNFNVAAKFSKYGDVVKLNQMNQDEGNVDGLYVMLINHLVENIKSIDGMEDREMLVTILSKAPRQFVSDLSSKIQKINEWGTEYNYDIECKTCGKKHNVPVSLNPMLFFTQPSEAETPSA